MKALVTGATGFIGSHLCEELGRLGYDVACLSRNTSGHLRVQNRKLTHIQGDCTVPESLRELPGDFDYVFHLAGLTKTCSPKDFFCVNARGTENLLKAIAERNPNIKRFLHVSSLAAAGPSEKGALVREDTPPSPVSDYGRSKLEGETAVLKYADTIPVTIVRPPAVYGPRDRDMLVMFRMIKKGFFFDLGKCYYSLLYVDDLVRGILLSAGSADATGKTYFLCDGQVYTGREIAKAISSALNVKARHVKVPKFILPVVAAAGEIINKRGIINRDRMQDFKHSHWICDAGKARLELGFTPRVTLEEGIRWTADWYKSHRWL